MIQIGFICYCWQQKYIIFIDNHVTDMVKKNISSRKFNYCKDSRIAAKIGLKSGSQVTQSFKGHGKFKVCKLSQLDN